MHYGRSVGSSVAKVKRHLHDTQRQMSRYSQLNKSNTLANRLNRILPNNTNFPETSIREKMTSTGMETSTKFKMSDAERALVENLHSQQYIANDS